MQPKRVVLLLSVALLVLLVAVRLTVSHVGKASSSENARAEENSAASAEKRSVSPGVLPRIHTLEKKKYEVRREYVNKSDPATSTPVFGVDPENQPRAFMTMDFTNLDSPPAGFALQNVVLSPEGFTLAAPAPGKENEPRTGIIESPPLMLDFFSNAVAPMWKENIPDGTDMFVEMSVSPDGVHWGPWQWIDIDEDSAGQISPTYPDGRPNPNYGYTPGTMLAWGLTQWGYVRYRVRLYSECAASPVLSGFRIFFQDSTLGEGRVASPDTMQVEEGPVANSSEGSSQNAQSQ